MEIPVHGPGESRKASNASRDSSWRRSPVSSIGEPLPDTRLAVPHTCSRSAALCASEPPAVASSSLAVGAADGTPVRVTITVTAVRAGEMAEVESTVDVEAAPSLRLGFSTHQADSFLSRLGLISASFCPDRDRYRQCRGSPKIGNLFRKPGKRVARPAGFEPATLGLEVRKLAISGFPKEHKYPISLYYFMAALLVSRVDFDNQPLAMIALLSQAVLHTVRNITNIVSHGSTPARTRACSDTTPRPDALYRALSRLDAVSDQAHVNVTHCQI